MSEKKDKKIENLPRILPVFPFPGVLLFPRLQLPLNIFEPRYVKMVDDSMTTTERMVGVIQPLCGLAGKNGGLYHVGCAGRIVKLEETGDGRYLIALSGLCRFRLGAELDQCEYRRFHVDYESYKIDYEQDDEEEFNLNRKIFSRLVSAYLKRIGLRLDLDFIDSTKISVLIDSLAILFPLEMSDKQAILEALRVKERAEILIAILEMVVKQMEPGGSDLN